MLVGCNRHSIIRFPIGDSSSKKSGNQYEFVSNIHTLNETELKQIITFKLVIQIKSQLVDEISYFREKKTANEMISSEMK